MNIAGYQVSLKDNACDIFLSGCKEPHCPECHNPDLWEFSAGKPWEGVIDGIISSVSDSGGLIKRFRIMGGEPLDQKQTELEQLLNFLRNTDFELWLFTSREMENIPSAIKALCDFIKTGRYEAGSQQVRVFDVTLASSNQNIYKRQEDGAWIPLAKAPV